jgi:hypothetical protein
MTLSPSADHEEQMKMKVAMMRALGKPRAHADSRSMHIETVDLNLPAPGQTPGWRRSDWAGTGMNVLMAGVVAVADDLNADELRLARETGVIAGGAVPRPYP